MAEEQELSSFLHERSMMIDEAQKNTSPIDSRPQEEVSAPVNDSRIDFSEPQSHARDEVDDYGVEEPEPLSHAVGSPSKESTVRSKKSVRFSQDVADNFAKSVDKPTVDGPTKMLTDAPREMVPASALSKDARAMITQLNDCIAEGDYSRLADLVFELEVEDASVQGQIDFEWYEAQCHSKFN